MYLKYIYIYIYITHILHDTYTSSLGVYVRARVYRSITHSILPVLKVELNTMVLYDILCTDDDVIVMPR